MSDGVCGLLAECVAARLAGDDFPTIWNTILKKHSLVIGLPAQHYDDRGLYLVIPLLPGQELVCNGWGFSLRYG
jgi:hypothetical protein